MTLKTISPVILLGLLVVFSFGCSRFATKGRMASNIENQLELGISETEFAEKMPAAELIEEKERRKVYLLAVEDPCLVCSSWGAFIRSSELYAMKITFDDGRLVSVDRILSGK